MVLFWTESSLAMFSVDVINAHYMCIQLMHMIIMHIACKFVGCSVDKPLRVASCI